MSTYLEMWKYVKMLTPLERKDWLKKTEPLIGEILDFHGVRVLDFDLYAALIEMETLELK